MDTKHPLAAWRDAQDPPMTQEALAEKCGVTRWTINSLETGRRKPSVALINRVATVTAGAIGFEQLAVAA